MDIGGALAAARGQAGMTIAEVSQRTRIREAIIRDIERDDFTACGGDFYARGHIRAIAHVVGADPEPLIKEYDAARNPLPEPDQASQDGAPDRHFLTPGRPAVAAGGPAGGHPGAGGITAAEAFRPSMPLYVRGSRRPVKTGALALILLAVIGVLAYLLVSGTSNSTAGTHRPSAGSAAHRSPGTAAHHTSPPARPSATASTAPAVVPLVPVSATAFGPGGAGQGDSPQLAGLVIDSSDSTGWHTDWYATAHFAGLQSGTGLLIDMGKPVSISTVKIILGAEAGGTFQVRAGNTPTLAGLTPVAQVTNTGGTMTVQVPNPVSARYLLIWFTSLPPDGAGTYQAYVYDVALTGTS